MKGWKRGLGVSMEAWVDLHQYAVYDHNVTGNIQDVAFPVYV